MKVYDLALNMSMNGSCKAARQKQSGYAQMIARGEFKYESPNFPSML